jgi:ubiquinone/menaquinone biosynthesis C-methylase UbiE
MMAEDLYTGFAERYDRFHSALGESDPTQAALFQQLLDQHGVCRVLDCASGTGTDLHLFHSLDCGVVGADISESMITQAAQDLTERVSKCPCTGQIAGSCHNALTVLLMP